MSYVDGPDSPERSNGSRIAVIDKAVHVLDALMLAPNGLTPTDAAAAIDSNRSTAFRLLTSLEQAGLLYRDALTGRYRLGVKFLQYGEAVRAGMALVDLADPIMRHLSAVTRQTVSLAVREGFGARYVHRIPGPEIEVFGWKIGDWLPMHAGAAAEALLSALPDSEVERYLAQGGERRTRLGVVSDDEIRSHIAVARQRGWSLNRAALTEGVLSLGVPVRDSSGGLVCAISVAGLGHHYQDDTIDDTAGAVMAAAREITAVLP
ncbi:IclR family transcriptional regulator [Microbacterium rhizomatis]|nr:IclR family transcriptional regulator [Microbacterium rhizomatis]